MGLKKKETVLARMLKALPEDFSTFNEANRNAIHEAIKLRNSEIHSKDVTFFYDKSHYKHYI